MSDQVSASGPLYRPSQETEVGLDAGMRRWLYAAAGAGFVLLVGIGAYAMMSHGTGEVPVIRAETRPVREKPANPGGMQVMATETRTDPNQSRLAPAIEEPNPTGLLDAPGVTTRAAAQAPAADAKPRGKGITVQLSMVRSEADAQAAWDKLAKKLPGLMGERRPLFQKTAETGQTPWRLRTGGFTDQAQARAFCDQVRAKGGKCVVMAES